MNHSHTKDHNLVEQYVTGKLSAEENEQFELHFLECEPCVEQIEYARSMCGALRSLSADEIEEFGGKMSSGFAGRMGGFFGSFTPNRQLLSVAGASLFLLLLSASLFSLKIVRLQRELQAAKYVGLTSPLSLSNRPNQVGTSVTPPQAASSEAQKPDTAPSVSPQSTQVLNKKRQTENSASMANRMIPQINTPVFVLNSVTEVERGQAKSQNELLLRPGVRLFVISLDPPDGAVQPFEATISDSESRLIWRGQGLRVDDHNALVLTFPSNMLSTGDYHLFLWQTGKQAEKVQVGDYPIHLSKVKS